MQFYVIMVSVSRSSFFFFYLSGSQSAHSLHMLGWDWLFGFMDFNASGGAPSLLPGHDRKVTHAASLHAIAAAKKNRG